MITRRCTQRQFLMRPDRETNNAFIYCLAVAAHRYGIRVLFTAAMSNHHHTGIEDPEGNYPAFLEYFHKLFAKCQNALRGRWENFWSSEQTSVVRLVDPTDILDKTVYALANAVKDGLVEKAHHWPGASSLESLVHRKPLVASRPNHFFREDGPMPDIVSLNLSRPQGFKDLTDSAFAALVLDRVRAVEETAAASGRRPSVCSTNIPRPSSTCRGRRQRRCSPNGYEANAASSRACGERTSNNIRPTLLPRTSYPIYTNVGAVYGRPRASSIRSRKRISCNLGRVIGLFPLWVFWTFGESFVSTCCRCGAAAALTSNLAIRSLQIFFAKPK